MNLSNSNKSIFQITSKYIVDLRLISVLFYLFVTLTIAIHTSAKL